MPPASGLPRPSAARPRSRPAARPWRRASRRLSASEAEAQARRAGCEDRRCDPRAGAGPRRPLLAERDPGRPSARAAASRGAGRLQALVHEADLRRRRRDAIAAEIAHLGRAAPRARQAARRSVRAPGSAEPRRARRPCGGAGRLSSAAAAPCMAEIEAAEAKRKDAADRLADGETRLAEADRAARAALEALAAAREARAGSQARHEAAVARLAEIGRAIARARWRRRRPASSRRPG